MKDNKNKISVRIIAGILAFIMIAVAAGATISLLVG